MSGPSVPTAAASAFARLRARFNAITPKARRRVIFDLLVTGAILGCAAGMLWWIGGNLVVRTLWIKAEADIIAPPRISPPEQRRGYAYWPLLRADLPDGRRVTAEAMRPIFAENRPPDTPDEPVRRVAPREGDRIAVYVSPSKPDRVMPATELNLFSPVTNLVMCAIGFAIFFRQVRRALSADQAEALD